MDGELLRRHAEDTMEIVRTELLPVLQLWYPMALDEVRDSLNLLGLRKVDLGMSTFLLASKLELALDEILAEYDIASRREERPSSAQAPSFVAVAFPRPEPMADVPAGNLLGEQWTHPLDPIGMRFPVADDVRSLALWQSVADKTWGQVTIRPQDIIGHGDARLTCEANVPVIEHIALFVIREGAQDNPSMNEYERKFDVKASSNQSFVSSRGWRTYQLKDGIWSRYEIPVFYGTPGEVARILDANPRMADQPPIGLSPFGGFEIDLSELVAIEQNGGKSGFDGFASAVVVGMQLGWRHGERLNWVETCPLR
jgi:hypothetical protein